MTSIVTLQRKAARLQDQAEKAMPEEIDPLLTRFDRQVFTKAEYRHKSGYISWGRFTRDQGEELMLWAHLQDARQSKQNALAKIILEWLNTPWDGVALQFLTTRQDNISGISSWQIEAIKSGKQAETIFSTRFKIRAHLQKLAYYPGKEVYERECAPAQI